MPNKLEPYYRTKSPVWLFTVRVPGTVVLRYCMGSPGDVAVSVQSSAGEAFVFQPGILSGLPQITHGMAGTVPSYNIKFMLPASLGLLPYEVDWASARVEIAHWFEGVPFEERRIMLDDLLKIPSIGDADEPISGTVSVSMVDLGTVLPSSARVTAETFPDSAELVGSKPSSAGFDDTQRYKAWGSEGSYYGEIVGRPKSVQLRVVKNDVLATPGVTDYSPFHAIVCDGTLRATTNRELEYDTTQRTNEKWKTTPPDDRYVETSDGKGRKVTLLNLFTSIVVDTRNSTPLFVPSSISVDPVDYIANLRYGGTWIQAGDSARIVGDPDSYFRVIAEYDDGNEEDSSYFGVAKLNDHYGLFSSPADDDTVAQVEIVPLIKSFDSIYLDCSTSGGRPMLTDPSRDLRDAHDVIWTYLSRSEGVTIDLDWVRGLSILSSYKVDGHLLDGAVPPLDWVSGDLEPLLPIAKSWEGSGLRYRYIGQDKQESGLSLMLGRSGPDGDRLSGMPTADLSTVINELTIRYKYRANTKTYVGTIQSAPADWNRGSTPSDTWVVNSRAIKSQSEYGRRAMTLETKWIEDEATARKVATQILDRKHKPRWRLSYQLRRRFGGVEVGDVVRVEDLGLGLMGAGAMVIQVTYSHNGPVVLLEEYDLL